MKWAVDPNNASFIRFGGQAKLGLFGLNSNSVTPSPRKEHCVAGKKKIPFLLFFSETELFFRFSFFFLTSVTVLFVSHLLKYFSFRLVAFLKKYR
jgi:hypothetical protein